MGKNFCASDKNMLRLGKERGGGTVLKLSATLKVR